MQTKLFIGGAWVEGSATPVLDPATGGHIADVAAGGADEARRMRGRRAGPAPLGGHGAPRAPEVLRPAGSRWSTTPTSSPSSSPENKASRWPTPGQITCAAEFFRWNSEEAVRIHGLLGTAPSGANRIIVRHPPVGGRRGHAVELPGGDDHPQQPLRRRQERRGDQARRGHQVLRIGELLADAGVPAGVVNIVPTTEPTAWFDAAVDRSTSVRMVSFTGSTQTGKILLRRAADRVPGWGWSSAATPRSSCSTTRMSTRPSPAPWWRRCATRPRCARRRTASTSKGVVGEFTDKLRGRNGLPHGRQRPDRRRHLRTDDQSRGDPQDRRTGPQRGHRGGGSRDRRSTRRRSRQLLLADRAGRRAHRCRDHLLGDLRAGGPRHHVHRHRHHARGRERHRAGSGRLRLQRRSRPGAPRRRAPRSGDGRRQPGAICRTRPLLRWGQAVGPRPRGGHDGIYDFCETQYIAASW
ncbi:MAG: aldehyde dehydrogenase family protein [Acidimicrobiales bacterium]